MVYKGEVRGRGGETEHLQRTDANINEAALQWDI